MSTRKTLSLTIVSVLAASQLALAGFTQPLSGNRPSETLWGGQTIYLGVNDLGVSVNRTAIDIKWGAGSDFTLTCDGSRLSLDYGAANPMTYTFSARSLNTLNFFIRPAGQSNASAATVALNLRNQAGQMPNAITPQMSGGNSWYAVGLNLGGGFTLCGKTGMITAPQGDEEIGNGSIQASAPTVPAPGALILGSLGSGLVSFLRNRKK